MAKLRQPVRKPTRVSIVKKINAGWQQIHTILIIISMVVGMTAGALTFFVSAAEFDKFQNTVLTYQIEDQLTNTNNRIAELNKEINSGTLTERERLDRLAEREKLERRADALNKKLEYMYSPQQQRSK
jgi:TolA-binding protein